MAAGGSTRAHAASAMFRDELASRRTRPNESARYQPYVRAARVEKSGDANSLLQVAEWTRARQPDTAGEGWQAAGEGYRCAQVRCSKRVFDNLAAGVSSRMEFSMRYAIFRKISTGTFGQVYEGRDLECDRTVAIKIVRRDDGATLDAMDEASKLSMISVQRSKFFPVCYATGQMYGHFCIVQERLGNDLARELARLRAVAGKPVGLSEFQAKNIARQLCEAVAFLNALGLTHTDLKTENIVLETKEASITDPDVKIKLIDLGCASWGGGAAGTVTQTCHYRAPEVLLGLEWHFPSDMWSVGCVLLELLESAITFDTLFLAQHLALIERIVGPIPQHLLRPAGPNVAQFLSQDRTRLLWPEVSGGGAHVPRAPDLEAQVLCAWPLQHRVEGGVLSLAFDFLCCVLAIDPAKRLSPMVARVHPWLLQPIVPTIASAIPSPVSSNWMAPTENSSPISWCVSAPSRVLTNQASLVATPTKSFFLSPARWECTQPSRGEICPQQAPPINYNSMSRAASTILAAGACGQTPRPDRWSGGVGLIRPAPVKPCSGALRRFQTLPLGPADAPTGLFPPTVTLNSLDVESSGPVLFLPGSKSWSQS